MRFSSRASLGLAAAAAALLAAPSASARGVDYRPTNGCPSHADVASRIDAQAPNGRDVRIDVRPAEGGFHGEVVLGEGDQRFSRSVEARTCSAVIEALSLVIALDREPAAVEGTRPPHDTTRGEEAPVKTAPRPEPAPGSRPLAPDGDARDEAPVAPPAKDRSGARAVFGSTITTTSFAQGELLLGTTLFAEIGAPLGGVAGVSWLKPSARASFVRVSTPAWTERDFTVTGGALDLCLGSPWSPARLELSACSRTELGSLAGSAGDEKSARSRFWTTTGAIGRARFVFATRSIVRPFIEVSGGLLATLTRDRFQFEGHDPIVASPWLWTAAIGGGIEL